MIIHNLFPTAVGTFNLGSDLTTEDLTFISNLELRGNKLNLTSADTYLFKRPELAKIAKFCNDSLQEYFQHTYAPTYNVRPYITQSWANYTNKGQSHHKHRHPNSIISGVFYVQAIKDIDRIIFENPISEILKLPTDEFNAYNSDSWWLGAETGQLLLFPSSLLHLVEEVTTETTRISISFNTFFKGYIGEETNLTLLNIET